ncbi:MAG: hypothetical protein GKS06_15865 [Acidobacteria bacterium]|nr:hypothetical protein [Acidobacteriota bacterium]
MLIATGHGTQGLGTMLTFTGTEVDMGRGEAIKQTMAAELSYAICYSVGPGNAAGPS